MSLIRYLEQILGSLSSPQAAEALTGDLIEESHCKGNQWLLIKHLTTIIRLYFSTLLHHPINILWIALVYWLVNNGVNNLVLSNLIEITNRLGWGEYLQLIITGHDTLRERPLATWALVLAANIFIRFSVGYMIGRLFDKAMFVVVLNATLFLILYSTAMTRQLLAGFHTVPVYIAILSQVPIMLFALFAGTSLGLRQRRRQAGS